MSAASAADQPTGRLPIYFTSFVGRHREMETLLEWVLRGSGAKSLQERVTTVVGLGGSGKPGWPWRRRGACPSPPVLGRLGWRFVGGLSAIVDRERVPSALAEAAGLDRPPRESARRVAPGAGTAPDLNGARQLRAPGPGV